MLSVPLLSNGSAPAPCRDARFRVSGRSLKKGASGLLLMGFLAGLGFSPAAAQNLGTRCTPETFRSIESIEVGPGRRITWMGRPTLRCPDGVRIQADSAVIFQETGRNQLIGQVRFTSAERTLLADLVDYFERDGRLFARGDVHFTDTGRDLDVEGDTLVYLEITPNRIEEEVTVYGGRPRTTLPGPESETGEASTPYQVEGDRLQFLGERFFWAYGDATIERDSLRAAADTFAFDQEADELNLTGSAWMESEGTRAEGHTLNLAFTDGRTERIRAVGEARLVDTDMELIGDEIQVTLGPDETPTSIVSRATPDGPLAQALTEEMTLRARLIEIDLPDGILQRIRAEGEAHGETFGEDRPPVDEDAPTLAGVPAGDFLAGAEIVATFEPVPEEELPPASDPDQEEDEDGEARYRMTGLEAIGNAVSLYRSPPEDWDEADGVVPLHLWSISYIMANRILITMVDGEVGFVNAEGQVAGIQLDPDRNYRPTPAQAPEAPEVSR